MVDVNKPYQRDNMARETPLELADKHRDPIILKSLLQHPNIQYEEYGWSKLTYEISTDKLSPADIAAIDVNEKDGRGCTPLACVVQVGNERFFTWSIWCP